MWLLLDAMIFCHNRESLLAKTFLPEVLLLLWSLAPTPTASDCLQIEVPLSISRLVKFVNDHILLFFEYRCKFISRREALGRVV
ncbi:hypothetical protein HHK36_010812 [Tetracentron sinense]|uniref:Secreted protein n=1 Tax=Tetracentron sinense TaxID=13715 RepID=A0A835DFN3_TETSI|nr:hypothetical protein HHK36_010812 [Tetracentron sinense]